MTITFQDIKRHRMSSGHEIWKFSQFLCFFDQIQKVLTTNWVQLGILDLLTVKLVSATFKESKGIFFNMQVTTKTTKEESGITDGKFNDRVSQFDISQAFFFRVLS